MERWIISVVLSAFAAVGVTANLLWSSGWMWERLPLMRWIMLAVLGGTGAVVLAKGLWEAVSRYRLAAGGKVAQGKVVDQRRERLPHLGGKHVGGGFHTDYYPVVEFSTDKGKTVRFEGLVPGVDEPIAATGSVIKVFYDPAKPARAVIADFRQAWLGPIGVLVAGVLLLACGVAGFARGAGVPVLEDRLSAAAVSRQLNRDAMEKGQYPRRVIGAVDRVQRLDSAGPASYAYVVKARRSAKSDSEEFSTDLFTFELDSSLVGSTVDIYLDPEDPNAYYVASGPLLREMESRQSK